MSAIEQNEIKKRPSSGSLFDWGGEGMSEDN
jgi:hypothetical protein